MAIDFRVSALPRELFGELLALSDAELAARGVRRVVADEKPGFPCRVSLEDAEVGERVLLMGFEHHAVATPYRGTGPIYVRERVLEAGLEGGRDVVFGVNEVPRMLRGRLLSLRGYDGGGMMVGAEVAEGSEFEGVVGRLFEGGAEYIHVHNAKPGCYNCRVERVGG